jgi:hypothetical protein
MVLKFRKFTILAGLSFFVSTITFQAIAKESPLSKFVLKDTSQLNRVEVESRPYKPTLEISQTSSTNRKIQSALGVCVAATTDASGTDVHMSNCNSGNTNLLWQKVPVTVQGQLRGYLLKSQVTGTCLDAATGAAGRNPYMNRCNTSNLNMLWVQKYPPGSGPGDLYHIKTQTTGYCLDANAGILGRKPYFRICDNGNNLNLRWSW